MRTIFLFLIVFFGCGPAEESSSLSRSPFWCPGDFYYNSDTKLCENRRDAYGPFTPEMIKTCEKWGGGLSCEKNIWEKSFARSIRGNSLCPPGTYHWNDLCTDGYDAYGPFYREMIPKCLEKGGGDVCHTMRWDAKFAHSIRKNVRVIHSKTFPFKGPALVDYASGSRRFGACRGNGCWRRHAGVDLVHHEGHPIYAVADGKVVDYMYFYQGTYALVIDHGDFVVRYGEVDSRVYARVGSWVRRGQLIARVGDLAGISSSMLHFEMYSGEASGPLTTRRRPYYRRWDLMNPTRYLKGWPYPR